MVVGNTVLTVTVDVMLFGPLTPPELVVGDIVVLVGIA